MSASTNRPRRTRRTATVLSALAGTAIAIAAGTALGQTPAGIAPPEAPVIEDVTCNVRCLDVRTVTETGRIEIAGSALDSVEEVRYPGEEGRLSVEPRDRSETSVVAAVPVGALSGKVSVVDSFGTRATAPVEIEIEPKSAIEEAGDFAVTRAEAVPRKSFYDGRRLSQVDYLFEADGATDVRIDVIRRSTGETVDSFVEEEQKPFANHSVTWNGLADRRVAEPGDYRFKVSALSGGAGAAAGFSYYDHIFPLRGKHDYGDGLGAGRGHQGQDVLAKCGTKVVAARGGKVQVSSYHSAAGNYLVIDGRKTGNDYVYMHLDSRGMPREGAKVKTGDVIGYESDTGRATGCNLHFELWSAPGWYEGGHVLNPTKPLKKWDGWS